MKMNKKFSLFSALIVIVMIREKSAFSMGMSNYRDTQLGFVMGSNSLTKSDGEKTLKQSGTSWGFEYNRFINSDTSILMGWRTMSEPKTGRAGYSITLLGARYFLIEQGILDTIKADENTFKSMTTWNAFIQGYSGLGRILFEPLANGAGDFSSEIIDNAIGVGIQKNFNPVFSASSTLTYEIINSIFGSSSSLSVKGSNLLFSMGICVTL